MSFAINFDKEILGKNKNLHAYQFSIIKIASIDSRPDLTHGMARFLTMVVTVHIPNVPFQASLLLYYLATIVEDVHWLVDGILALSVLPQASCVLEFAVTFAARNFLSDRVQVFYVSFQVKLVLEHFAAVFARNMYGVVRVRDVLSQKGLVFPEIATCSHLNGVSA